MRFLLALPLLAGLVVPASDALALAQQGYVVCTDFQSASLAAVNAATRAVTPDVASIHTDAVVRWYAGRVYVVNRAGADNVQVMDPAQGFAVVRQFSTGNGTNPQDIAFVSPAKAYVTLFERAQLAIVNPATGASLGQISLAPFADADGLPEMARMIRVDRWLFVALQRLDRSQIFLPPTDTSLVVVVDTEADTVVDANPALPGTQGIVLPRTNPITDFAFDRAATRLLIGCVGFFGAPDGGVVRIDPVGLGSDGVAITEAALGGDLADLEWNGAAHSYAIVSDAGFNTSLVAWSAITGTALGTVYAPGGFSLTDAALDDRGELWVCNANLLAPGLFVFRAGADTLLAGPLDAGLPPYVMSFDAGDEVLAAPGPDAPAVARAAPAPNPARDQVGFALSLPAARRVTLEVLDLAGRRVITLADGEIPAGRSRWTWRLADERGRAVPAGVYLVRARGAGFAVTRRLVAIR